MTYEESLKLIEKAKELGVSELTTEGFTVKFKDNSQKLSPELPKKPVIPDKLAEELIKPISVLDSLTEEEMLYYATPYFDEMMAKKEAMAKKAAGEPG
jgi:hypothetical protein